MITTQRELNRHFWQVLESELPELFKRRNGIKRKANSYTEYPQNSQPAEIRCLYVDFVDQAERSGTITESLSQRTTLK